MTCSSCKTRESIHQIQFRLDGQVFGKLEFCPLCLQAITGLIRSGGFIEGASSSLGGDFINEGYAVVKVPKKPELN